MSSLINQVQVLEDLLQKLYPKVESLKKTLKENTLEIDLLKEEIKRLNQQNFDLNAENEKLKMINTLLGGTENKRDAKLKINSLIKEIDACIAYMAE
jgi:predicted transcriptional regulator